MNYYNEHDPKTAAWLRELIGRGLIPDGVVTGLGQALRGCSASCRAARGTLDKEPIPLTAICNSVSFSIVRSSRSPACGRHQERETLHTTRTPSERSGYACENESDLSPVTVFFCPLAIQRTPIWFSFMKCSHALRYARLPALIRTKPLVILTRKDRKGNAAHPA